MFRTAEPCFTIKPPYSRLKSRVCGGYLIKVANGNPAILNGEICAGPCAPASDISVWVRGDKTESCREAKSLFDEYFRKAQKYIMESITADAVRLNRAWANVYDM